MAIFVFGSNLAGRHGAGAALFAKNHRGAIYGVGKGPQGNAYGIPTKDQNLNVICIAQIAAYVAEFLQYARSRPELEFEVTRIGCGLAGYKESDMAPLFKNAPVNCALPPGWRVLQPPHTSESGA
jgi:hypothetical protein